MKMKRYSSFEEYLADQPRENKTIIVALRRFVKRTAPRLHESVKWGNGCWLDEDDEPVSYVYSDQDHVQFGFFAGARLKDPKGLLHGQGKFVRHIKLRKTGDLDERAFAALLKQAAG
jgi:hypothetical protein